MSNQVVLPPPPTDSAYIAHLWDYAQLTIAIFGMQVHTPEAYAMYQVAGIPAQMVEALREADGLLCVCDFAEGNGGLQLQYWRSHEDVARFAQLMLWWIPQSKRSMIWLTFLSWIIGILFFAARAGFGQRPGHPIFVMLTIFLPALAALFMDEPPEFIRKFHIFKNIEDEPVPTTESAHE